MGDRGRKPAAELATVTALPGYPEPLPGMTPEAKEIWRDTVRALPVDWFRPEVLPTLEQFCNHTVEGKELTRQIESYKGTAEEFDPKQYDLLLKMRDRENRAANNLARSMRITLQSTTLHNKSKGKGAVIKKPWEA